MANKNSKQIKVQDNFIEKKKEIKCKYVCYIVHALASYIYLLNVQFIQHN